MEEENIIWKEIETAPFSEKPKEQMDTEPCKKRSYTSLYAELEDKCNPKKYMSPYNKEKVDIANELYSELLSLPKDSNLRSLRDKATQKLGIVFSTKRLYESLLNYCNPQKFMKPYDFNTIHIANHYYSLVEEFKNDIHELEKLNDEIRQNTLLKTFYKEQKKQKERQEQQDTTIIITIIIIFTIIAILFLLLLQ